ncbi:PREDICTED: probable RNA polymerase II nuclear localization protein SLC7A6OS [Trachymyrmex cornetzi]|uniref:probable RNA polymerase II nuclear localization protein SLC7A6OS n=1 Tax=Trachymyrmex cornetzi TaxID=471704 RepID=UPI00084EF643|nr:PREDICTED: probable RNA polymerase II nuclear localization protein SLC7A6OS [Trachymyrmex cornetzi]
MAAILRVKRKNTDSPLDALVIACKRSKTEVSVSDTSPVETVVQFAGTLTDPTENVTKHVGKFLDIENFKVGVKRVSDSDYPANISGKIPKWIDDRYKVTDYQSLDTSNDPEFKDMNMVLIDVEDLFSVHHQTIEERVKDLDVSEELHNYVYDLYCAQTSNDLWFENDEDNILVRRPDYSDSVEFEQNDESSDSNAESNWKNDYPDTDPDRTSDSSFSDYLDISGDENECDEFRRIIDNYGYIRKRRNGESSSSHSDWLEKSMSDKEEIEDEISCNEETSDDERTEEKFHTLSINDEDI